MIQGLSFAGVLSKVFCHNIMGSHDHIFFVKFERIEYLATFASDYFVFCIYFCIYNSMLFF
jgi:hypothetical protein